MESSLARQENVDLEPVIPESDDEFDYRRQRKKKSKPAIPTTPPRIPSLAFAIMSNPTMRLGELAAREYEYCPLQAVTKYPYRYLNKGDSDAVSTAFFAAGQFRARGWSLYYIHTYIPSTKPLVLVPAVEFQALLEDIDKQLDIQLEFPSTPGFRICFSDKGSPHARYLGQLTPKMDLTSLERMIPGPHFNENGENEVLDDRSFAAFKKKIEASIEAGKNKSKAAKEKKRSERVVQKKGWCAQLKRAQRYLGVRPRRTGTVMDDPLRNADLPWEELEKARKAYQFAAGISLPNLDVTKPVPYLFDLDVVFVCVDVEAYERGHRAVTEIGISSLDTRDLVDVAPGEGGTTWLDKIRSRHFRIIEYGHLRNTDFVVGCADRFEKAFGISEWISKKEASKVVASCFRPPFATRPLNAITTLQCPPTEQSPNTTSQTNGSALPSSDVGHDDVAQPKRNLILVGHDIKTDIHYLRDLGYDVSNLSNILEAIDTADLHRALKREQNPRNLGQVLFDLGLTGWNLHNAGNDAAYTLQAMIGLAFAGLATKRERQAHSAEQSAHLETVAREAQDRVKEGSEEWELAEGEGGDGGSAVGLPRRDSAAGDVEPAKAGKAGKAGKAVAQEKVAREEKRAEQGAAGQLADSTWSREASSNGSEGKEKVARTISGRNDNQDEAIIFNNTVNAASATHPADIDSVHQEQKHEQPIEKKELPSQFTTRMAFLDMDDDDEGGVTVVWK